MQMIIVLIEDSRDKLKEAVVEWKEELRIKGLKMNINKCNIMHVGRKGENSLRITFGGGQLVRVKEYKYLGVVFDRDARIDQQASNRMSKTNTRPI